MEDPAAQKALVAVLEMMGRNGVSEGNLDEMASSGFKAAAWKRGYSCG
jgi:hypothetical protein